MKSKHFLAGKQNINNWSEIWLLKCLVSSDKSRGTLRKGAHQIQDVSFRLLERQQGLSDSLCFQSQNVRVLCDMNQVKLGEHRLLHTLSDQMVEYFSQV